MTPARRKLLSVLLFIGCFLLSCGNAFAAHPGGPALRPFKVGYRVIDLKYQGDEGPRTFAIAIWYPTTAAPQRIQYGGPTTGSVAVNGPIDRSKGPYPLLVFSHGYGGSGLSSAFFTEELAAQGWIVVAPDHNDQDSFFRLRKGKNKTFDKKAFWQHVSEITNSGPQDRPRYMYRIQEIKTALNAMLSPGWFKDAIDETRVAVGGHSFGAFTALGLCGTIDGLRDPRIKAALLFSSGAAGYLYTESELAKVRVPSMYFLGEKEERQTRGKSTMLEIATKLYGNLPPPKYFLEIKGGDHFSFNNQLVRSVGSWMLSGNEREFNVIRRYSIAFLETYVAGKPGYENVLNQQDPMLTRYEKQLAIR
jgi:predicted dienelactone hydrolase